MGSAIVLKGPLGERISELIDHARRQAVLVGIDPDRRHLPPPKSAGTMGAGWHGQMCVESDPRSYEATAGPPITKAGALVTEANDAAITLRATRPRTEPSHRWEGRSSLTHVPLTEPR